MSGGWTVVDANSNKSLPITGKNDSGAVSPYFNPAPGAQDPVGKMRISQPTAHPRQDATTTRWTCRNACSWTPTYHLIRQRSKLELAA